MTTAELSILSIIFLVGLIGWVRRQLRRFQGYVYLDQKHLSKLLEASGYSDNIYMDKESK